MKIILTEKQIKHLLNEQINEQTNAETITPVNKIPQQRVGISKQTPVYSGSTVQLIMGSDNKFYMIDVNNKSKMWSIPYNKISQVFNPSTIGLVNSALKSRKINTYIPSVKLISPQEVEYSGSTVQLHISTNGKFYLVDKNNVKNLWPITNDKIIQIFDKNTISSANSELKKRGLKTLPSVIPNTESITKTDFYSLKGSKIKPFKLISSQVATYSGSTVQLNIGRDKNLYLVDINDPYNVWNIPNKKISEVFKNPEAIALINSELKNLGIEQSVITPAPDSKQNNTKEQQWLGTWKKFLVKYYGFKGDDTTIGKKVYEFIANNKYLYNKNKNLNKLNLLNGGVFGPVHESFMPPYYTTNETFPIYFYQKSNVIKNIQIKLGVKQTGYFLTLTENAIIKRLNFKKTQGYNVTYNRKTGVTKEIYDVIMSQDTTAPAINTPDYSQGLNPAINTPDYSQGLNPAINAQDYSQGLNTSGSQT
jgi:hypothetical protein